MADNFFWYDVMTTDAGAAGKFYCDVVGWGTADSGSPGYTLFTIGERGVAGLMGIPESEFKEKNIPPCWMGYILVQDVDATAARIVAEGGTLHKPPTDVPGVIRFAVVADPQGAGFIIAKPMPTAAPPTLPAGTPGTIGWHELYAGEWQSAFAFYEKLFGWTKADALDMGPMGTYLLFAAGGEAVGGMMTRPPGIPVAYWGFYINVAALDAAIERVKAGGGQVLMGPHEVPGGQWVMQGKDPQGALFALVAPKR